MSTPRKPKSPDAMTFEEALAQIEGIIERIEAGEVGLEASLAEYERGVGLINHCRGKLDRARRQVEDLTRRLDTADDGAAASAGTPDTGGDEPEDDGGEPAA